MYRRSFLTTTALVPLGFLIGCASNQTASQIGAQVVTDTGYVAQGIGTLFNEFSSQMASGLATTLAGWANTIATDAASLSATMTDAAANSPLSQISADVTAFLGDIKALVAAGSTAAQVVSDVTIVLQVALEAAGVVVAAPLVMTTADIAGARGRLSVLPHVVFPLK